jgi:hypothetical protein
MGRPYVWHTNEWGESYKVYLDDDPPPGNMPACDMGGISDDPWGPHRSWQKRNRTFIKDVQYEDDSDPYDHL